MTHLRRNPSQWPLCLCFGVAAALLCLASAAWAQGKGEKTFAAVLTDAQGVETEVKHLLFYWEEKISETAFVPHELKEVPVKRGNATVKVKFESIKQIEVKAASDTSLPLLTITLTNGKSGDFTLAIAGTFRGASDFGDIELPANSVKKIVIK